MQKIKIKKVLLPNMYMKTPLSEESIQVDDETCIVHTKIDISIYKIGENNYSSVISKDFVFSDGYTESILLEYFTNIRTMDEILDMTDSFLENYRC